MEAITDRPLVIVGVLTADRRRRTADLTVVPCRLTVVVLMRARCRLMAEPTRVPLLHPTVVVWAVERRLTVVAGRMVHLLVAEVDRQAGSAAVGMPLADSTAVGTVQAVEGIAVEAAAGTAAVVTVAVTKN